MIALVWWLVIAPTAAAAPPPPPPPPRPAVLIATPRGETSVPLTMERGSAAVAVSLLAQPLALTTALDGLGGRGGATVGLGGMTFVFQLGLPFARAGAAVCVLVSEPYVARDSLFLPLRWLAECVPRALGSRYRWDAAAARFEEFRAAGAVAAPAANPLTRLRLHRSQ